VIDITNKPSFLRRYKIQPNTNEPVNTKKLTNVVLSVLFNQIFVGIPFAIFSYYLLKFRGIPNVRELPTFHWVLIELGICIIVEEFGFYYSHRLLHNKLIYKHIHKQHHLWQSPVAITAIYAHPIEYIFSNILPVFLGVLICGSHIATAWFWFTIALLSTLNAHSGYHLPFFPSPEAHDYHHRFFNCNFGMLGLLDRLHGTDTPFRYSQYVYINSAQKVRSIIYRKSPQGARHTMLLSLTPAHQVFPDEKPKSL
jgi:fatty acid hydroxylase domain-containing protein 2